MIARITSVLETLLMRLRANVTQPACSDIECRREWICTLQSFYEQDYTDCLEDILKLFHHPNTPKI